jgi:hypothetical protein
MAFGIETLPFPAVCCSKRIPQHNTTLRSSAVYVWGYCKQHEIGNFCPADFAHLGRVARGRLRSIQYRRTLVAAFYKQAELSLSIVIALLNVQ